MPTLNYNVKRTDCFIRVYLHWSMHITDCFIRIFYRRLLYYNTNLTGKDLQPLCNSLCFMPKNYTSIIGLGQQVIQKTLKYNTIVILVL